MFHKQAIRDCFQRHYVIIPSRDYDAQSNIEPVEFWDLEYTRRFVGNLYVPEDYWRGMLDRLGVYGGTSINEIEIAVSEILLNRQFVVLPITPFPTSGDGKVARTLQLDD
jgi:hypothetical protein